MRAPCPSPMPSIERMNKCYTTRHKYVVLQYISVASKYALNSYSLIIMGALTSAHYCSIFQDYLVGIKRMLTAFPRHIVKDYDVSAISIHCIIFQYYLLITRSYYRSSCQAWLIIMGQLVWWFCKSASIFFCTT